MDNPLRLTSDNRYGHI